MTPRSRLGHSYRVPAGDDPIAADELALAYRGRFLDGPVFLTGDERRAVVHDLLRTYDLLRSLPDRLFGGSLAALARSVGMNEVQTALVTRAARTGSLAPLGRADLYHDGTGFALLELNVTSALGGFENADLNRAMLAYRPLRDFVAHHDLRFQDTLRSMVQTVYAEGAALIPAGRPPVVAVVDTAANFRLVGTRLRILAGKLAGYGVEGVACPLEELTYPLGRPTAGGRAVDVVLRYFMIEDMADPIPAAALEPLLTAVERGKVGLVSRLDAELYGNKGTLALLSDDRHRAQFDAAELACLDRLLPWTRYVRSRTPGLLAHARAHQDDLILKPTLLHGGTGVVAGWRVDPAEWTARVAAALDGPYVLQRRVRPAAEPVADRTGGTRDIYLNWGIYFADGYAGCLARASADPAVGVVSMADGAAVTATFHAR